MWYQETQTGKYQFFERYTDPVTGNKKITSITLPSATNSNRKYAEKALFERIRRFTVTNANSYDITLEALKSKYIEWKYANLKEQTAIGSEQRLNRIVNKIGGNLKVKNLTARYVAEKLDAAPTTYNEKIKHFKAMIRWGYLNDYLPNDSIADKLRPKKTVPSRERNARKYLEHDEIKTLLDNFIPKWKLITEFLILSGMRIGEALDLKKDDVQGREIRVDSTYSMIANKSSSTKTETSDRVIFIQDELMDCIVRVRELYHSDDPYFFEFGDRKTAYGAYVKYFRENTERLLGRKLTPHCLRHTHTALLAEAGIPLEQISRRLGHADSKITKEIYLHITEKMKERENERLKSLKII